MAVIYGFKPVLILTSHFQTLLITLLFKKADLQSNISFFEFKCLYIEISPIDLF